MPDTATMIELIEVTRRYGRKGAVPDALGAVTLSIPRGAVWAVVGPNGAGKSTLLSLILGFIRPSEGTITVDGEKPRDYVRECGAAWLPERFALPAQWRTLDALRMFARLEGVAPAEAERVLALLGLEDAADRRVSELSRGTLQRVGVAQALLAPRDLVILDEPTEGLDPMWRIRLRDIVTGLRNDGRTIIIASHDLAEIERAADHAVVLDGGVVKDVLDVRARDEVLRYRITLEQAADVSVAFPDAVMESVTRCTVTVGSAAELTQRLSALIDTGAIISAVEPLRAALEDRVRDTLGEGA